MATVGISDFDALGKGLVYKWTYISEPLPSGPSESCLVSDSDVGRFVPESPKPRISSESDSAALAPLQQDLRVWRGSVSITRPYP
jgi:hypothetical protein